MTPTAHNLLARVAQGWRESKLAFVASCDGDVVELAHASGLLAAVVLEDVSSRPGGWRVSRFDDCGAIGHHVEPTREKALMLAFEMGFRTVSPGAVDAIIDWSKAE